MDSFVTGGMIRRLREEKGLTQTKLAERLHVSDKAVSRWETGKGYPDITLIEPLAAALGVSVMELLSGGEIHNRNRSFNMKRGVFYVCPLCGNVILSTGEAAISCCGLPLLPQEAEKEDDEHRLSIEPMEDEFFVSLEHEMTRQHYISFLAAVRDDGVEIVKLYPEGPAEARFQCRRVSFILAYCNRHGLYKIPIRR